MFTIDLLKGKGVPAKIGPEDVAVAAVAFVVPLIIALVMLGGFLHNRIVISIQTAAMANYDAKINQLADAVQLQKSFENEKNAVNSSLAEVASNIGGHIQWSPVLVTLVENMPGPVFLTKLDVKQNSVKVKMPQKDDPKKTIETQVPAKTLQMSLLGSSPAGCDKEVRDFRDRLRAVIPAASRQQLEDIKVAQQVGKFEEKDAVSYEINFIFKPRL
jgi:Tfp pilus assembly protein PilN